MLDIPTNCWASLPSHGQKTENLQASRLLFEQMPSFAVFAANSILWIVDGGEGDALATVESFHRDDVSTVFRRNIEGNKVDF
jgi:hypothetical protein